MEVVPPPPSSGHQWTTEGPNVLAEENLGRIWQALLDGWVGGIHMYYCAGCGCDPVAFSTYDQFLAHVTESRKGDLFLLWSVADLRRKRLLLVDRRYEDATTSGDSLLSQGDLDRVRSYLAQAESNEILSLSSAGDGKVKAIWTELESSGWEPFLEEAGRTAVPGGAMYVLPFTQVDSDEFYLVKAKRPNSEGQVPLGGAY